MSKIKNKHLRINFCSHPHLSKSLIVINTYLAKKNDVMKFDGYKMFKLEV